jgi:hypothetical protein
MIPICRGGLTVESNLCIACASCNQEKGCLTKDEYNYFKNTLSEKEYNKQKGLYQEFINNHKNLFYNVTSVMDIEKIQVSKAFTNSTIRNEKIEKVLDYYSTHGEIDKPIVITKNGKLVDGYIRYFVCKMIGLEHIPVTMIN